VDREKYLEHVNDAYKAQGKVTGIVGLYLATCPGTIAGVELSGDILNMSMALEEKLCELYQVEKESGEL